jgi:hypothetical protein
VRVGGSIAALPEGNYPSRMVPGHICFPLGRGKRQ